MNSKINEILAQLTVSCSGEKYVLPQLAHLASIEYIVVGDNPGQEELNCGKYFSGKTRYIRCFFRKMFGDDYEKYVLFLNKTPIFSPITNKLKNNNNKDKIEKTQKLMADLILELIKKNAKVHVWIMGKSELKGLFKSFYDKLEDNPNVCVFNHPSRCWFLRTDLRNALKKKHLTKSEFEKMNFSKAILNTLNKIGTNNKMDL